ncbi:MAG TPA: aldehyde dehydrogenase family protein [Acidobacteriaceae bacterium]|nr:aldehyde dehydrogenase family protein [Acidobacteriaceae bacterium]
MRRAQNHWARSKWADKEKILRRFRGIVAENAGELARLMPSSLARTYADTLSAEVLPLLDACKFLEREAEEILRPQRPGNHRRPLWLQGIRMEVHRDPLGIVLVIAPSNYPLFLPGVQALQALAAGNACIWKPAAGCEGIAHALRQFFLDAGVVPELLWVTDSSVEIAKSFLGAQVDKVFFTGSASTGQDVLRQLADFATPAVMELSGCDAVFVLPEADVTRVTQALAFGTRFNGSATCMAPRRVFVPRAVTADLESRLMATLSTVPAVALNADARRLLDELIEDAQRKGAHLVLDGRGAASLVGPVVVTNANETMRIAQTDIFGPVLALIPCNDQEAALQMYRASPFALTAAIFGAEREARTLADQIVAGTVILNDLIVPTADPRVPFGGRRASGYGVTRGREGLLEMTAPKVILIQRARYRLHYQPATGSHFDFFVGVIRGMHGERWRTRVCGWIQALRTGRRIQRAEQILSGKQER